MCSRQPSRRRKGSLLLAIITVLKTDLRKRSRHNRIKRGLTRKDSPGIRARAKEETKAQGTQPLLSIRDGSATALTKTSNDTAYGARNQETRAKELHAADDYLTSQRLVRLRANVAELKDVMRVAVTDCETSQTQPGIRCLPISHRRRLPSRCLGRIAPFFTLFPPTPLLFDTPAWAIYCRLLCRKRTT